MKFVTSLKNALTINFILAAVLPVAVFAFVSTRYVSDYLLDDVAKDNLFLAREVRAQSEDFLDRPIEVLSEVISTLNSGDLKSSGEINAYLEREVRHSNHLESIYILDQEGWVVNLGVSSTLEMKKQDYQSIDLSGHDVFQQALKPGQVFWSDTFISVVTGEPSLIVGMTYGEKILVGNLNLKRLNQIISRFTDAKNISFAIIDRIGSLIAHSDKEMAAQRINMMYHPEVREALDGGQNIPLHEHEDHSLLESVVIIPQTGWAVWVGRDRSLVLEPVNQARNFMMVVLGLSFLAGIALAIFNSRKIMKPISELVDATSSLADGEYNFESAASSYVEVDNLASGFNRMAWAVVDREKSVREREARFRNLVNSIDGIVWEYDLKLGRYTFVSRHCVKMLGCTYQQWLGSPDFWETLIHPDDRQWVLDYIQGLIQGSLAPQIEYRMVNTAGKIVWVRNMVNVVVDEGDPVRLYGVIIDINDRKKSEIALRNSELRFRSLIEQAADIILIHDRNGNFAEVNDQACRSYGYSRHEMLAMSMSDLEVEHDPLRIASLWNSVQHGNAVTIESNHRRKDGSVFPVEARLGAFEFQNEPLFLALIRDTTERKKADAALRESEERFRNYFEIGLIGMSVRDRNGQFLQVNDRLCEIVGYSRSELVMKTWLDLTHPDDRGSNTKAMQELLAGKMKRLTLEKRYVRKDGEIVFVSVSIVGIKNSSGKIEQTIAVAEDISQRKLAENALFESEEQIRLLLNSTAEGIYSTDQAGICTLCNPAALEMLGYQSEDEVIGKNMHELIHYSHLDGSALTQEECQIKNAISKMQAAYSADEVFWKADGSWFYVEYRAHPVVKEGEIVGSVVTFHDITEQKLLHQQSIRTAQLASLGELAAGVAHEINNPINGVINYAQILLNRLQNSNIDTDLADRIIKEGERIATIVRDLLFFARESGPEVRLANVDDLLAEALSLTEAQIRKEGISLQIDAAGDLPQVYTRAQQIQQLFLNVLSNARHALNEKYPERDDRKKIEIFIDVAEKRKKQFVRVSIKDYGCGIPGKMLEKVMTPFVTTKPAGVGTGLGLSISHEIVNNHKGEFEIKSREGKWTEVVVILPAVEKDEDE